MTDRLSGMTIREALTLAKEKPGTVVGCPESEYEYRFTDTGILMWRRATGGVWRLAAISAFSLSEALSDEWEVRK